jgi:hypothetical protein
MIAGVIIGIIVLTGRVPNYATLQKASPAQCEKAFMNLKLIVAIAIVSALPAFAHSQQDAPRPNAPKPTKAQVKKVVQSVGADKTKPRQHCDIGKLDQRIAQAEQKQHFLSDGGNKLCCHLHTLPIIQTIKTSTPPKANALSIIKWWPAVFVSPLVPRIIFSELRQAQ